MIPEDLRLDLLDMIEDDPALFQFNGVEYRGTLSGINRSRPLEVGGFTDLPQISIAINVKDAYGDNVFGQDRPRVGSRITYREAEYRVDSIEIDPQEEAMQLNLRSKDQ